MDYEDLVIQLDAGAGGATTVRVSSRIAGESEPEPFVVPVVADEIDRLAAAFGRAARDLRPTATGEISAAAQAELGDRLFRALLPPAARSRYDESWGQVKDLPARGLRLQIRTGLGGGGGVPAELQAIPWELLRSQHHFLARGRKTSVVRYLDLEIGGYRPPAPRPLAILAVAGDEPTLDLVRERREIEEAWRGQGRVHIKQLSEVTLETLREELLAHDYHVLHFMGHGGFNPAAGEGSLALLDEQGRRAWASGPAVAEQVRGLVSLRLVVLNACWTARTSSSGPYAGVATAMLRAGIPAVVAMQFPISDGAALSFSRIFYRRLARGDTIDAAVTDGRLAIHNGRHSLEWATPVLFQRLPGGRIVEPARPARWWPWRAPGRRRAAPSAAALLLLACLLGLWAGNGLRLPSPGDRITGAASSAGDGRASATGEPAAPAGAAGGERATASGASRGRKPRPSAGARIYELAAGESIEARELSATVTAHDLSRGAEPEATLDIISRGLAAEHRVVQPGTDISVNLDHGTGHLVVLSIDLSAQRVKLSAEPNPPPPGATAQCRDGFYSFSQTRGGTCSSHGGVARRLGTP
jgi:hypothetical protein